MKYSRYLILDKKNFCSVRGCWCHYSFIQITALITNLRSCQYTPSFLHWRFPMPHTLLVSHHIRDLFLHWNKYRNNIKTLQLIRPRQSSQLPSDVFPFPPHSIATSHIHLTFHLISSLPPYNIAIFHIHSKIPSLAYTSKLYYLPLKLFSWLGYRRHILCKQ